jgi:23S rRNA (uracil1939-C5)-methyltransferase
MDRDILSKFPTPFSVQTSVCPHAAECPGCPLLDMAYPAQLAHKTEHVRAALSCYAELAALKVQPCAEASRPLGYRSRAKWVSDGAALGLFARGSHRVIDVPQCRVVDPMVAEASARLRELLTAAPWIEGADIAHVGEQLLITLIVAHSARAADIEAVAARFADALPTLAGLAYARRESGAVQLLTAGHQLLRGRAELALKAEAGAPYHYVAFGAFLQAHADTARSINAHLTAATLALRDTKLAPRVLELYAGSGALALALAARGLAVTAVESYAPACERIERAAREQQLSLTVECGDAEARALALAKAGRRFDVVLVNPPRRGLTPRVREAIAALQPARVGYVSCKPETLGRDLAHFARLGLHAAEAQPFDMIPQTEQVETLVWLAQGPRPPLEILRREATWTALHKPAHQAWKTHEQRAELHARLADLGGEHALMEAPDSSGVALLCAPGRAPTVTRRSFQVLVKGVTRQRGKAAGLRYARERVVGGHSLLRVDAVDESALRQTLRRFGHPVLGDAPMDRASAKYFWLRHGLDRPFLHLSELTLEAEGAEHTLIAPLPADLRASLDSLERASSAHAQAVEEDARDGQ